MTIISFANSKGGAGKSTLCLLIASELAAAGTKVLIIDADEQQSCSQWAERCRKAGTLPDAIIIKPASTPEDLKSLLQESEVDIVLIDVQGSMNKMLIAAIVAEVYLRLNCKGMVRIDFILQEDTDNFYFIEVNTTPGQSANSLIPQQVRAAGMNVGEFYGSLIEGCLKRL